MLRIIEGSLFPGAHEYITERVLENVTRGVRTYLIVPEQQTLTLEGELAEKLPSGAPLYFEVSNFTRFSDTVRRAVGGLTLPLCDATTKKLIMWRVLTSLKDELEMCQGREINAGIVDRALSLVMTFESFGVEANEISLAIERLDIDNKRLISKLRDGVRILSEYKRVLHESYSDSVDELEKTTRTIKERGDFLRDAEFFLEGFTSFTEGQYRLISALSRICDVSVALPLPKHKRDAFEYREVLKAYRRLLTDADIGGVKKTLISTTDNISSEFIYECVNELWRVGGKINEKIEYSGEVSLYECYTPYEECDFVASDIRRRIEEGLSYRDIAIIAGSTEGYEGILELSLSRYDIPHFTVSKRGIEGYLPIRLIYSAIEAIISGYRQENVIAYCKCTPSLISREECDIFELYTTMWGISGEAFYREGVWNMNPDGYTTRHSADMGERLLAINATRDRVIAPLRALDIAFSRSATVKDFASALYTFITDISLYDMIKEHKFSLIALSESESAYEYGRLPFAISSALDTLVRVSGETECTRESFLSQLRVVFSSTSIGKLPLFYDTVSFGSADMIRLHDKKHIYIIGANRGVFPRNIPDEGYLTEKEKALLSTLGLNVSDDTEINSAREMFFFIRAMAYANESVTISYTKKTAGLGDIQPSDAVKRLIAISGRKIMAKSPPSFAKDRIFNEATALYELPRLDESEEEAVRGLLIEKGYSEFIDRLNLPIDQRDIVSGGEVILEYHEGSLALTQSRLDDYRACPLLYFLKYDLRLRTEDKAELDARNVGTFIHAVLESFFGRVKNENIPIDTISDDMAKDMIKRASVDFVKSINDGSTTLSRREELLIDRLCRVSLPVVKEMCTELRTSKFIPTFFELKLEDANTPGTPSCAKFFDEEGREVSVYGTVDRVDTYKCDGEVYVRVIDYKTGAKDFSPRDLDEGKNLQMFLYLKAIVESEDKEFLSALGVSEGKAPIPASVIYIRCSVGNVKASSPSMIDTALSKVNSRHGMILNDDLVLSATGNAYAPVKFNKNGSVNSGDIEKLYTREGWNVLMGRIGEFISSTAKRIRCGDVRPTPDRNGACQYCQYKDICRIK